MYNSFFILSIVNLVFSLLMFRDNKLDVCALYPLYILGWLIYFFGFGNTPVTMWSYILGALLGVGALAIFLSHRLANKDIWLGIQPVILIFLYFLPLLTTIASSAVYFTLMSRGLT